MLKRLMATCLIVLVIGQQVVAKEQSKRQVLELASTEWCPYACSNSGSDKGLVAEYLSYVLAKENIELSVIFLPWSRAIREVESGRIAGLLTATQAEAPSFSFTTVPSMYYQMCFYGKQNSHWQFTDKQSLSQIRLGTMSGYGYGEPVDSMLSGEQVPKSWQILSGEEGLRRLLSLLSINRIDAFIEDKYVVGWHVKDNGIKPPRLAGCLDKVPFYTAFSPKYEKRNEMIVLIDKVLSDPANQAEFHQVYLKKYFY